MAWWVWAVAGLVLLGAELFVPVDFFVFFLGIAALGVSGASALGLVTSLTAQLLLFSVLAVASMLGLRSPLVARLRRAQDTGVGIETLIGEVATLLHPLEPGQVSRAELRGTTWSVRSDHAEPLPAGRRCRVERVEGLVLWVRPE
ncbi:MAG TPA: NfeD family protein [Candidatus Limnocylindria bacterium]|nr:NfeD family protein [Candidatus Limnocylindria bacterium]